jgi:hypothetical protein
MKDNLPLIVAYGGGINSTAMLCGLRERGVKPDLIIFADTGAELPNTYKHIQIMSNISKDWWGVQIETVYAKYKGQYETLENACLRKKTLPSLAYGRKACSLKHKVVPQDRRTKEWMRANGVNRIVKAIGYDADEKRRSANRYEGNLTKKLTNLFWYPLIEWGWGRDLCVDAIKRHNIPLPGKSSCFFCPSMKFREILELKTKNPDYYERAIKLEENMEVKGRVRGLNFGKPWSEMVKESESQGNLFAWVDQHAPAPIPCGCYDG